MMTIPAATTRFATSTDAATCGRLIDAMDSHYLGVGNSRGADAATAMVVRCFATEEGTRFLLAFLGDRAVGIACFVVIRPGHRLSGLIFLKDVFVLEDARCNGVGRALMAGLAGYALDAGIGRIDLTTDHDNVGALRLYDALGGQRQPKIMFRFDGKQLADLAGRSGPP